MNIRILDLSYNPFINKTGVLEKIILVFCKNAENLNILNLSGIIINSYVFWDQLLTIMINLQELRCRNCNINDYDGNIANKIDGNNIEILDVSSNNLSMNSLEILIFKLKSLVSLNFSYNVPNRINVPGLFSEFKKNLEDSSLKTLKIKGFTHNIEDFRLFQRFLQLETLDLSSNDQSSIQCILDCLVDYFFKEKLAGNEVKGLLKSFKMKKIKKNKTNEEFFYFLNSLTKVLIHQTELKNLSLCGNGMNFDEIMEILRYVTAGLEKLNLLGNCIKEEEKKEISSFIKDVYSKLKVFVI